MAKKYGKDLHMSKICRTFAAKIQTSMMKKTYIQPQITATQLRTQGLMLPSSPTDGGMDPQLTPNPAPKHNTEVF